MSEASREQEDARESPEPQEAPGVAPAQAARPRGARRAKARRWIRRVVVAVAAVIAAILVSLFSIDIGNISVGGRSLRSLAESRASSFLKRPMHIGSLSALITPGKFALDNVVIEGPTPEARPFFSAQRITVDLPWWALFRNEVYLEVRLSGWRMVVENWPDGTHMPNLKPQTTSTGPSRIKWMSAAVYANSGEFVYDDHVSNWSVIARNLQFALVRAANLNTYVGMARFSDGTTKILDFLPMRTDFSTRFQLNGSVVNLRHIDLITDGAKSHVSGFVNFGNWPEQEYRVSSEIDFARMREIFFASQTFRLSGDGRFTGIFRFFKGGRELVGEFESEEAGLGIRNSEWRFPNLHGALEWKPDRFVVTHADSDFIGGLLRLTYGMAPLGTPHGSTSTLTAQYEGVDLYRFTRQFGFTALEPQGQMRGNVSMAWPTGKFTPGMQGTGDTIIVPPEGASVAAATLPSRADPVEPEVSFQKYRPFGFFALAADTTYRFTASTLDFEPSWVATPTTYVTFSGHARGDPVDVPFHVTSHDWQNSDRLFAAIMTNFGSQMGAIEVGGRGTFDGRLTKAFKAPRIEGRFAGGAMRAWKVVWGSVEGDIAIENNYLALTNGRIEHESGGRIQTSGRFSLGYPRADGGEEIDAAVTVENMPLEPLKRAFGLDDWPVTGTVASAEMRLAGLYTKPRQTGPPGTLRIVNGTAWEEAFDTVSGELLFEGDGSLRIRAMDMEKAGGRITGDAWVSWEENRYSFRAQSEGSGIPIDKLTTFKFERAPLTGQLTFKAGGDGSFDEPAWRFEGRVADLYAADEGIGVVRGTLTLDKGVLTISEFDAASDRLQIQGGGAISLNEQNDATLHFSFLKTSLDPYLKFVAQELPFNRAVASGTVNITGPLSDPAHLSVGVTVDQADLTLFDYPLRNIGEIRIALENNIYKLEQVKFGGEGTSLELSGSVDANARTTDIRAKGQANLAVLQAFYPDIRAGGTAELTAALSGSFDDLALVGQADIVKGELRHQALPHGFRDINGPIVMESGRISVDKLRAVLGEGAVTFGGAILLDGYRPEEYSLTARGRSMHLRFPPGLQSTVDADLSLRGPVNAPMLSGNVDVLRASYSLRLRPEAGYFDWLAAATGGGPAAPAAPVPSVPAVPGIPMALDIRVRSGVTQFIENKAGSIFGTAEVDITGTLDQPSVTGRVNLDRGEWVFSGYRYRLQPGSIIFSNPLKFDPFFDVAATTRVQTTGQSYDVNLHVTGPLDKLDITVLSEPWLPEAQIISLLFGESPDVGAAELRLRSSPGELQAQAARAAGLAFLTSPISGTIGSVLERATAIDTVQIVPLFGGEAGFEQLNPTARIMLGKRVSERIYVTYSVTLNAAQSEIILIEFDQSDQLSWILSRNEDRSFALDFRIKYVIK